MFLTFEGWGTCYQIFGTNIAIDWILRTVFSQLSRKLDRAEDFLHVQASSPLSWTYRKPSAQSGLLSWTGLFTPDFESKIHKLVPKLHYYWDPVFV